MCGSWLAAHFFSLRYRFFARIFGESVTAHYIINCKSHKKTFNFIKNFYTRNNYHYNCVMIETLSAAYQVDKEVRAHKNLILSLSNIILLPLKTFLTHKVCEITFTNNTFALPTKLLKEISEKQ